MYDTFQYERFIIYETLNTSLLLYEINQLITRKVTFSLCRFKNILDLSQSNFDYKDFLNINANKDDEQVFEAI